MSDGGDIERVVDDANRDVLVGRRLEVFFDPNDDGTPSTRGKLIWHTEWRSYSGSLLRGTELGPRIERTIEQVLAGEFGGMPGPVIIAAVKAAYVAHACEDFGIALEGEVAPEPEPELEPQPGGDGEAEGEGAQPVEGGG